MSIEENILPLENHIEDWNELMKIVHSIVFFQFQIRFQKIFLIREPEIKDYTIGVTEVLE